MPLPNVALSQSLSDGLAAKEMERLLSFSLCCLLLVAAAAAEPRRGRGRTPHPVAEAKDGRKAKGSAWDALGTCDI